MSKEFIMMHRPQFDFNNKIDMFIYAVLFIIFSCTNRKSFEFISQKYNKGIYEITLIRNKESNHVIMNIKKEGKEIYTESLERLPHKLIDIKNDSIYLDYYVLSRTINDYDAYQRLDSNLVIVKQYRTVKATLNMKDEQIDSVSEKGDSLLLYDKNILMENISKSSLEFDGEFFFIKKFEPIDHSLNFTTLLINDEKLKSSYLLMTKSELPITQ